jgi:hypothetical protein
MGLLKKLLGLTKPEVWAYRCPECGYAYRISRDLIDRYPEHTESCFACDNDPDSKTVLRDAFLVDSDWHEDTDDYFDISEERRKKKENEEQEREKEKQRQWVEECDKLNREEPEHCFRIRRGCEICFRLPFDFTEREAIRLREFVMTIPIDIEDQELFSPEMIVHAYRLRHDYNVNLWLPEDLTESEANRLGAFFESLPMQ